MGVVETDVGYFVCVQCLLGLASIYYNFCLLLLYLRIKPDCAEIDILPVFKCYGI
jgi:hypothetical protein